MDFDVAAATGTPTLPLNFLRVCDPFWSASPCHSDAPMCHNLIDFIRLFFKSDGCCPAYFRVLMPKILAKRAALPASRTPDCVKLPVGSLVTSRGCVRTYSRQSRGCGASARSGTAACRRSDAGVHGPGLG